MTPEQRLAVIQGALAQVIAEERRAAAAEEREACAKIADAEKMRELDGFDMACSIAASIRNRK